MATKTEMRTAIGSTASGSYLPGLVGIAAALGIWMLAQPVHDEVRALQQQIGISAQSKSASGGEAMADLEGLAAQSRERRAMIEARLQNRDTPAIAYAKVLHDLRQRCAAAGIQNCAVRFVDETVPTSLPGGAGTVGQAGESTGRPTLASLGLGRSKAVISGQFQDLEFRTLINQLGEQSSGVWRLSALSVRNNRFELDAELISRPLQAVGNRAP